jgi:hypothetical protein
MSIIEIKTAEKKLSAVPHPTMPDLTTPCLT